MKRLQFNLTRQFAVLSFLCIFVVGSVATAMVSEIISDKILLRDATLSMEFIQSVIAAEGTWNMFLDKPEITGHEQSTSSHWALESFFSHVGHMPDVVWANVYGIDRSILWSSSPDRFWNSQEHNKELKEALKGNLIFNSGIIGVADTNEHIHFDKSKEGLRFIETYIPVWNKDHDMVVGAVELCRVPVILHQSISEAKRFVWLASISGGLLIFFSLFWIVKRASLVIKNQHQRLIESKSFMMIGQTASAITHAMRNPLASIRACAELSLTDDLEGVRESAMDIMGETDRLDRWARDLLKFSVTNTESFECLDVNDLVAKVLREHEPVLNRSAIQIELNMTETELPVEANVTPLSQIFGNLIMNAVEAMGEDGKLTVTTFLDAGSNKAIVRIVDNGPGLSDEIKERLFQPFASTKSTGTGLGLPLSRHLVEHFEGSLEITTNESGQGVTATVSLPLSRRPQRSAAQQAEGI